MTVRQKWQLGFADLFFVIGIADIALTVFWRFDWLHFLLGIALVFAGGLSARKIRNESTNASN